jgi:hypothetical protein
VVASWSPTLAPPLAPVAMLLLMRRQRSTFHLGEEDGVHRRSTQRVKTTDAAVGLRILVQDACTTQPCSSYIVLKQMMVLLSTSCAACGFLSSCFLCRRELSLDKDVYMYRCESAHYLTIQGCNYKATLRALDHAFLILILCVLCCVRCLSQGPGVLQQGVPAAADLKRRGEGA